MQIFKIFYQLRNHLLFVMGADNQRKAFGFRKLFGFFHFSKKTEPGNDKVVNRKKHDQELQRYHDKIKIRSHVAPSPFCCFTNNKQYTSLSTPAIKYVNMQTNGQPEGRCHNIYKPIKIARITG